MRRLNNSKTDRMLAGGRGRAGKSCNKCLAMKDGICILGYETGKLGDGEHRALENCPKPLLMVDLMMEIEIRKAGVMR